MNETQEIHNVQVEETSVTSSLSRLHREHEVADNGTEFPGEKFKLVVPWFHKLYLVLFSIILAGLSVTVPTFFDFASPLQMQGLYMGQAFLNGQVPYADLFASGGILYYAALALATFLGSSMWLIFLEFVFYFISGIYFFKLVYFLTNRVETAAAFTPVFYLLNFGLGLGGLYAIQWANAFVLMGLWLLLTYFMGFRKDEWFIAYGFVAAVAIFIDVRTLVFWVLAFLVLSLHNIAKKRWKRGFYQNLCILWGLIIVIFTVGYFALNLQLIKPYIEQTIVYGLTHFTVDNQNLTYGLGAQLVLLLGSGLAYGIIFFFGHLGDDKELQSFKWLLLLTSLVYAVMAVLSQTFQTYPLLILLPFGLILTALATNHGYDKKLRKSEKVFEEPISRDIWGFFIKRHIFLPFLVVIAGVGLATYRYVTHLGLDSERSVIAQYIEENSSTSDKIYVWDTSTALYLETGRLSATQFVLPVEGTSSTTNQQLLEDQLLQNSATFIVVNKSLSLPATVQANLDSHYEEIVSESVSHFKIYHLN
ncbi:DUF2079 domain-containing protein [Streptococcus caprae]|uniref:DUF2079 domain-containing protein n=1 Tax=Streptococcus caprae TaxID=1640501 RepID=A0ABV8CTC4_9STRE